MTVHDLPAVNATLNGLSAVFLTLGFIFIKRGQKIAHRNCMIAAFTTSTIFLGCYLTYHALVKTVTHFTNPEWFRPIYLTILLTHTLLAAVIAGYLPEIHARRNRAAVSQSGAAGPPDRSRARASSSLPCSGPGW